MTRTIATVLKPELQYNVADTLYFEFILNGVLTSTTTGSSAKVSITKWNGTDITGGPISAATATWSGSLISYPLTATNNSEIGEDFIATWTIVSSSATYYRTQLYDVVKNKFEILISKEDLYGEDPELANLTFSTDTNYVEPIISAHNDIADLIRDRGKRPALVFDNQRLSKSHINLALSKIYYSFTKDVNDIYMEKSKFYKDRFKETFDAAMSKLVYDADEDNLPDDPKENISFIRVKRT